MSAALAEKLNEIGEAMSALGELFTEASALYDAESAKRGTAGNDGTTGKVSGQGGKAGVGQKGVAGGKGKAGGAGVDDDLPEPSAAASKGKAAAGKTAGGKGKAKAPTEDEVRAKAKEVIESKGREKAVEILSEYGNGKLADVDASDYPACFAALEAALAEDDPAGVDDI